MPWQLVHVSDVECTMDDSGVFVTVYRITEEITHKDRKGSLVSVRADLWQRTDNGDEPLVSFVGTANAERKHLIRFLNTESSGLCRPWISHEHASYIGYELHRAQVTENYVQD